jgi:nitrite reductase/ring-hydroxylating ferredoxin subunit
MQWHELSDDSKQLLEQLKMQQLAKLTFDGKAICVTKLEDGLFGIHNTCPHAGAQFHHGHCNKKGIVGCPLHGYKFDIKTGRSADGNNYKIAHYQFKIEADKLYIGFK